jgi:transposase
MKEVVASDNRPAWIGLDVAKRTFDAAVHPAWQPGQGMAFSDMPKQSFPRTADGVAQLLAWVDAMGLEVEVRAVMESTGRYSVELAAWLTVGRPSMVPVIVDPKAVCHFIRSLRLRNKTDRADAAALARYGAERAPEAQPPPTPEYAALREMSRERTFIVTSLVAARNRLEEIKDAQEVVALQREIIRDLEKILERIESLMRRHVEVHASLREAVSRLDTIPGVAFITAATILGELGDLTRFRKSRSLSAFAGTSPRRFESGDSVKGKTRMCKQGPPQVRHSLYMAALSAIRGDNSLARFYAALVAKGKPKMVAIGAVMRKMLVLMRALLIKQADYHNGWGHEKISLSA